MAEAVTSTGRTSKTPALSPLPAGISCENWTGSLRSSPALRRHRRRPSGHALAAALSDAGLAVDGPLGRGADPHADVVLLTVPDAEIEAAAAALTPGRARSPGTAPAPRRSTPLAGARSVQPASADDRPGGSGPRAFAGAGAAIAGSTPAALAVAQSLAGALDMRAVEVADADRAAYHAAASIAANFLVTLEGAAERLAATAGVPASCWSRSPARRSRTGRSRAPSAPSPARWRAATRRRSTASAPRSRSGRPTCSTALRRVVAVLPRPWSRRPT